MTRKGEERRGEERKGEKEIKENVYGLGKKKLNCLCLQIT